MRFVIRWMSLIFIIVFGFTSTSLGKSGSTALPKTKLLESKAQLEELISKRYRDQISTQLDSSLFSVSVRIEVKEVTENQPKKNIEVSPKKTQPVEKDSVKETFKSSIQSVMPEDLSLGIVGPSSIIEHYKQQLEELKTRLNSLQPPQVTVINQATEELPQTRIEITSVEVSVGLDSALRASYRREFEEWLKKTVDSDFGTFGTYKVSLLRKVAKPEEVAKVITPLEQISNIQILLGFGLLAFVLFLGLLIAKFLPSRDIKEQNQVALQIQEMRGAQSSTERREARPAKKVENDSNQNGATGSKGNAENFVLIYRDVQLKVSSVFSENPNMLGTLLDSWMQQGYQGKTKITSFIDAVMSRNEKVGPRAITLPDKYRKDLELQQVFKEFSNLGIEDRVAILEEAYWDMLALDMLGEKVMNTKFSSLADLNHDRLNNVLGNQDAKIKALALMHLPLEKTQQYVGDLTSDDKRQLIESSLELNFVREEDLVNIDANFKARVEKEQVPEGVVDLLQRLPNILSSLSPQEEIAWLPEAVSKLPDQGIKIKRVYPSLAFLKDWSNEGLEILFEGLDTKVASTYLRLVPDLTERVLKFFPPRLASIIKDEASLRRLNADRETEKHLLELRDKMLELIDAGDINLERVIKMGSDNSSALGTERKTA